MCSVIFTSLSIQRACVGLLEHVCPCINRIAHNELTAPLIPRCVGFNCALTSPYWFEQVSDLRESVCFCCLCHVQNKGMTQWGAYSLILNSPPPLFIQCTPVKLTRGEAMLRLYNYTDTHSCVCTDTHLLLLTLSPRGIQCRLVPKLPGCSLKLHSGQPCYGNLSYFELISALLELRDEDDDGLWCVWGFEDTALPAISGPHHCDVTNRGHGKDRGTRTKFSRTHVYLVPLCVCVWYLGHSRATGK